MDEETEAPLDDMDAAQDDSEDETYVGRSSSGGSVVGSGVASSAVT